jgi:hypothetical protein
MNRRLTKWLWALVAVNLFLRLFVALRSLEHIDGYAIPDDAYLALTLARSIANGLGPFYSLGFTNGFQPLYVFLMAPIYWLFPNDPFLPIHASLILLAIFDTLALLVLLALIRRFTESPVTSVIAALAWIFNPYVMRTSANGLETTIAFFFLALAYYYYHRLEIHKTENASASRLFVFGVVLGLAVLARIDSAIFALVMTAAMVYSHLGSRATPRKIFGEMLMIAVGLAFAYLPWVVYSLHYTGDIIPISGAAVRYISTWSINHDYWSPAWYLNEIYWAGGTIVKYNIVLLALTAALGLLAGALWRRKALEELTGRIKPHLPLVISAAALFAAYAFYIFGNWYFKRYLFPVVLPLMIVFALMIDYFLSRPGRSIRTAVAGIVSITVIGSCIAHPIFRALYFGRDTSEMSYMNLGLWARERFEPGTIVGSCQTGALAYFADSLVVVNLDGVVNKKGFEALIAKRGIDYMRETGIEYYVDWETNRMFIEKESANFSPGDLVEIEKVEGFSSWRHEWFVCRVTPAPESPPLDDAAIPPK